MVWLHQEHNIGTLRIFDCIKFIFAVIVGYLVRRSVFRNKRALRIKTDFAGCNFYDKILLHVVPKRQQHGFFITRRCRKVFCTRTVLHAAVTQNNKVF